MGSSESLAPISRHILAAYYDKHPFSLPNNDVFDLSSQIQSLAFDLINNSTALQDENLLIEEANRDPVYKIEWNLWKNREHMEEIIYLLDNSRWPAMLQHPSTTEESELARVLTKMDDMFKNSLNILVSFQDMISERVFSRVMILFPQPIRRIVMRQHKEREMNGKAKFDESVTSGASIGARYALWWEQQMDMRRQLKQVASSICFCQTPREQDENSVRKVILDLFPTIHDEDWPMEEQGERYGPPLYRLTAMIFSIRLFVSLLWGRYEASKLKSDHVIILNKAVDVYTHEFERFITFISEVFEGSPFFISADVVGRGIDDFKAISVSAGKTHEVSLEVNTINSTISWDFFLVVAGIFEEKVNWDIDFSLEFQDAFGNTTIVLPTQRCGAH